MLLVLRHEPFEHLGNLANALHSAGQSFTYNGLGDPIPRAKYDGIIVMGGPQSANDSELSDELGSIREAISAGTPVLGICLGSQLIAKALGASVYKNSVKEIGWEPVYLTENAKNDPIFSTIASPTTFFHWHGETFDLPPGTDWLAYSEKCRHQAFRYRQRVYGIQFHPEITPEMIVDWSSQPANCGDVESLHSAINPYAADTSDLADQILRGWLGTF